MTEGEAWRLRGDDLARRGAAVAVRSRSEELSYAELASRAASVWRRLVSAGLVPGEAVGLLSGGRGMDEPIALAGCLTMGAVVVPLDASAPPARLAAIVRSSGCRAIVHDLETSRLAGGIAERLGDARPAGVVLDGTGRIVGNTERGPANEARPLRHELCSVLHTSGSTGVPKPVPIAWRGIDAFTAWASELLRLSPGDRVLRVAELGFDLAWFDHLATWRTGATLVTTSRRDLAAGKSLLAAFRALEPTVVYAVPSLYMKLTAALGESETLPSCLRAIVFAGEPFPPRELAVLAARAPGAELWNFFGPTETNVCTYHRVLPEEIDPERPIPIGRACPYARCVLVDERGEVVEGPGIGELVVEGPTTIGGGPYATRDRVERDAGGCFHFRGRLDRMVKIRGYRVEPGEVEQALCAHPSVRAAAVTIEHDARLGTTLGAFVVLAAEVENVERTLRAHVAERLPPYMVPERVRVVEELPLGATGKIDREALSKAGALDPDAG